MGTVWFIGSGERSSAVGKRSKTMVFSSISFLFFFLPILIILYYLIPASMREGRNGLLLLFSLFFYGYGGPRFLALMLCSICVNYLCGRFAAEGYPPLVRRIAAISAVAAGIGLLGWFKYAGFFAEILNSMGAYLPIPEVTLPIGISFFTFQGLSYVIDVYRNEVQAQKNPLRLGLYIALFPQLVAGPIVRYTTVAEELGGRRESLDEFCSGTVRFLFGLGKKMLIANSMGELADTAFGLPVESLSTPVAWIGLVGYTLQIYFDFSAYSDMAIGLGHMFGFHFLENFNYPYIAQSIREFWQRWHISLSTWFRDYVYIPLGGSRGSKLLHIRNLLIVWFLTGLWHGAAWNFVIWGLWFFVLLAGERYLWGSLLEKLPPLARHSYTLLLVMLSWVFFRASSLSYAAGYLQALFGLSRGSGYGGQAVYLLKQYWPELMCAVVAAMPVKTALADMLSARSCRGAFRSLSRWGPRVLALGLLALSYVKLVTDAFNPFIYFRF